MRDGGLRAPSATVPLRVDVTPAWARGVMRLIGEPATAIKSKSATLYVSPSTYRPLQLIEKFNGGKAITIAFHALETLPNSALRFPNIVLKYPHAEVAPWERTYWQHYWNKPNSGDTRTRRQALADLRNQN